MPGIVVFTDQKNQQIIIALFYGEIGLFDFRIHIKINYNLS